jgi:hypothetical protein
MFQMFLELLDSDRRVCEAVACCLCKLTAAVRVRVCYYSDPGIANLKQTVGVPQIKQTGVFGDIECTCDREELHMAQKLTL